MNTKKTKIEKYTYENSLGFPHPTSVPDVDRIEPHHSFLDKTNKYEFDQFHWVSRFDLEIFETKMANPRKISILGTLPHPVRARPRSGRASRHFFPDQKKHAKLINFQQFQNLNLRFGDQNGKSTSWKCEIQIRRRSIRLGIHFHLHHQSISFLGPALKFRYLSETDLIHFSKIGLLYISNGT